MTQGRTTWTPNPVRQPPIPKTNTELDRIDQQITALKVAKSKIIERTKGNTTNQNRGKSIKQPEDTPEQPRGPKIVEDITILPPPLSSPTLSRGT